MPVYDIITLWTIDPSLVDSRAWGAVRPVDEVGSSMTAAPFPSRLRFAGESYELVKVRFLGGGTYRSVTGEKYLRIGVTSQIEAEVMATRTRLRDGFPVAPVIARGVLDADRAFFVEESLGETTFGDVFAAQTERDSRVDDAGFDRYLNTILRYLAAQCATAEASCDVARDMATIVRHEAALRDSPVSSTENLIAAAYRKACQAVTAHPWCPSQGDLNPFNTLPAGVIDFELAARGPLGYDVLTAVHFGRYWPRQYVAYVLDDAQVRRYEDAVDHVLRQHGTTVTADMRDTFLFMKAFWATSKDAYHSRKAAVDAPFWRWRSDLRRRCAELYLRGQPIRTSEFAGLTMDERDPVE